MSEHLQHHENPRITEFYREIAQLEAGRPIILGGKYDIEYIRRKIIQLQAEEPSLSTEISALLEKLNTVDPNLSETIKYFVSGVRM